MLQKLRDVFREGKIINAKKMSTKILKKINNVINNFTKYMALKCYFTHSKGWVKLIFCSICFLACNKDGATTLIM